MKLLVVTKLCFAVSILLSLCTSLKTSLARSPNDQTDYVVLDLAKLPRKLTPIEGPLQVQDSINRDYKSNSATSGAFSERPYDQIDMQQFMTMDYSGPRMRRPIHNRVVQGAP